MNRSTAAASLHPTAKTFASLVLESDTPVLVDFWAPWCQPCLMLKPELERLSTELGGRAKVAFINVDEEPELAELFGVSSIPALVVMKGGKPVDAWTGFANRAAVLARMAPHLS